MIQNVLRDIGGVGIYGVISICLFFAVFGGALLWAFLRNKTFLNAMSSLPLDERDESETSRDPDRPAPCEERGCGQSRATPRAGIRLCRRHGSNERSDPRSVSRTRISSRLRPNQGDLCDE
jgi:hypothetical protein